MLSVLVNCAVIFGVACGCAGAWRGNYTSWALIASAGLSSSFIWLGVPFLVPVWMLIDLAVVAVVTSRPMKCSDCLVVALFVGAWPLYPSVQAGDPEASALVNLIVAIQFILTAPWRWALHKLNLRRADLKAEGDFLRVRHA